MRKCVYGRLKKLTNRAIRKPVKRRIRGLRIVSKSKIYVAYRNKKRLSALILFDEYKNIFFNYMLIICEIKNFNDLNLIIIISNILFVALGHIF